MQPGNKVEEFAHCMKPIEFQIPDQLFNQLTELTV